MRDTTETVNLRLRLPEGLRQKLANEAEKANRSLNSEILFRLNKTLGPEFAELAKAAEERERREQEIEQETVKRIMQDPEMHSRIAKIVAQLSEKRKKR
jgi:ribosomal protein L2